MILAQKDYYPRLGATFDQLFYVEFWLIMQTLLIPLIFYITKDIQQTLIPYLCFFEFFIPIIFLFALSNKKMSYYYLEECSLKKNKRLYKFFLALLITFSVTFVIYLFAFGECKAPFLLINTKYSLLKNKALILLSLFVLPVIEEFHWRMYCMKSITSSNEQLLWMNLHYGIMVFLLFQSQDEFSWKISLLFGILSFIYQLALSFLKKDFRTIGTILIHIFGNIAIFFSFYLVMNNE